MSEAIFIECGDVTINRERILYVKKSVDEGAYVVFFDTQESMIVSGKSADHFLWQLRRMRSATARPPTSPFDNADLISRRKQHAREANMIPCSRCGREAMPRGVTYVGPVVCQGCLSKEQRFRMA